MNYLFVFREAAMYGGLQLSLLTKAKHSRLQSTSTHGRKEIAHGKHKFTRGTSKSLTSRQKQIIHSKSKSLTAKANHSRQEQIAHSKSKSLSAKAYSKFAYGQSKSLTSRQKQIILDKSKSPTAKANHSRQEQINPNVPAMFSSIRVLTPI